MTPSMTLVLYDLAGSDPAVRFSPYCWRIKMALAHKHIAHEARPWRFADKASIAEAGSKTTPVIDHDGRWLSESWRIATYLDATFPERPLMASEAERRLTRTFSTWVDHNVLPAFARQIVSDILPILDAADVSYFRESREARFGRPLHEVTADRDQTLLQLRQMLAPARMAIESGGFLAGSAAGYADYVLFAAFQWVRAVNARQLLAADDPLDHWRLRMLDLYDGLAARAPVAHPERLTQ